MKPSHVRYRRLRMETEIHRKPIRKTTHGLDKGIFFVFGCIQKSPPIFLVGPILQAHRRHECFVICQELKNLFANLFIPVVFAQVK